MSIPVTRNPSLPNQQARLRRRELCQRCPQTTCRLQGRGIKSDLQCVGEKEIQESNREPRYQCLHDLILLLPASQAQANCTLQSNQLERKGNHCQSHGFIHQYPSSNLTLCSSWRIHLTDLIDRPESLDVIQVQNIVSPTCHSKMAYYDMLFNASSHASRLQCNEPESQKGEGKVKV